jgi:hypothetical protein
MTTRPKGCLPGAVVALRGTLLGRAATVAGALGPVVAGRRDGKEGWIP